jgi:hypothetical protein
LYWINLKTETKTSAENLDPVEVATQTFFGVATEYGSRKKFSEKFLGRDRNIFPERDRLRIATGIFFWDATGF